VIESQHTVADWCRKTFGVPKPLRSMNRLAEEFHELEVAFDSTDSTTPDLNKIAAEMADVLIVMYQLADVLGISLHDEVDKKMKINRARRWQLDGTGCGYHVQDKSKES
jgi:NTP pyrophosphatase (non-canonical NTP hydrolase)